MQDLRNFIQEINNEFQPIVGDSFIKIEGGELFSKSEVKKYVQRKLEIFNAKTLQHNNDAAVKEFGIDVTQRLINEKSKTPKRNHEANKAEYDGTGKLGFNIVYRERLEELSNMKLDKNEKLVYYVLRDFVQHPSRLCND